MNQWVAVETDIFTNGKFIDLEDCFDGVMSRGDVFVALFSLWSYAMKHAPSGQISVTDKKLGRICGIEKHGRGDVTDAAWANALLECGWIDEVVTPSENGSVDRPDYTIAIHDWGEHGGKYIRDRDDNRTQAAVRQRIHRLISGNHPDFAAIRARDGDRCRFCGKAVQWDKRNRPNGGTIEALTDGDSLTPENAVTCCYSCRQRHNNGSGKSTLLPAPNDEPDLSRGQPSDSHAVVTRLSRGSNAVEKTPITRHHAVDRVTSRGTPDPFIVNENPDRVTSRGVTRLQDSTRQEVVVEEKENLNNDDNDDDSATGYAAVLGERQVKRITASLARSWPSFSEPWFFETLRLAEQKAGPLDYKTLLPRITRAKSQIERLAGLPSEHSQYVAKPDQYFRKLMVNVLGEK